MYYVNWKILNKAMKEKNLDDQMLADKLGVPRTRIVMWRYRKSGPQRKGSELLLDKLCQILDVDKSRVLREPNIPPKTLYEDLLEAMYSTVKLANIVENYDDVFQDALGKDGFSKLRNAIECVRVSTARAYMVFEGNRDSYFDGSDGNLNEGGFKRKRGRPKKAPATGGDGEEIA